MRRVKGETRRPARRRKARRSTGSAIGLISSLIGSDRLLDLVLSNTDDLIVILDSAGKRIYNSPSYRQVLGDPDTLRGTDSFAEIHPEDREDVEKLFRQTLTTGKGKRAHFRFLLRGGRVKHIESQGHLIRDAKGDARYVAVISRDITSHRETRMQLAETEATFRGLVENSFAGVYMIQDGRFAYVNPRICEITGYTAGELTGGMGITDIAALAERARVEESLRRHLTEEKANHWYTVRGIRKDGSQIDLEIAGTSTHHEGRAAIIGTIVDITEKKRAESLQHALYRITERASTLTSLHDFYQAIHAILSELVYGRNFYIAVYDRGTGDLSFPYFVDEYDPPPPPHKPGRGLTEYVLRSGRPLLASPEVFQDLVDKGEVVLLGGESVDWLGVPLMDGQEPFGVIAIQSYTDAVRFGRKEEEILTYISRHIAVAVERKRTEAALLENEERLRAIISGTGGGILLHDARGSLLSWNPGALRILDVTEGELDGWPFHRTEVNPIHESGKPFSSAEYPPSVSLRTGTPCTDTVVGFRTRGGDRRWISITTQPLMRTGDRSPYAVVTSFADITRRKEAEDGLYRSEQRFRSLVEAIPDWIWETDASGRYTYASPKVKDLLGFEPAEVLGKRPRDFMQAPDDQEFGMQLMSFASRGEPFSGFQNRHVRKDGRTVVLETSGVPVFDEKGQFRGYRGIDRDVTARKHEEVERAMLKEAVGQAAESILITRPDGTIVYANPAFEKVTGYSRHDVIGKTPAILRSGKHDTVFFASLWSAITRGEVWSGRITNRKRDGSLFEEEMVISPVRDFAGTIVNFVAVMRDMTREIEMERRLRQSQKMESLGQLAGGIAHDFNNVLGVIQGGLALLKPRVDDPALSRYIEMSESAVNRGADVAQRLLTFSRDGQVQLRPIALADVVDELTRVLQHTIEKTVEIVTDIPHDLPIIQGDAGQLYQMLLNLCINARDAILDPAGERKTGRITIAATMLRGDTVRKSFKDAIAPMYIRVSVADTGSGISEDVRGRIFEPFYTTKPTGKGTGLGLAVVYGIVKSHYGFIDLETAAGSGTTFHVYLVAYPEEKLATARKNSEAIVGGTETILVVEDEDALRNLLTELLQSYGYRVIQAADGIAGLDRFTRHRDEISAVITDMGLPRMSGQDLFSRIREIDPASCIVLASGYLDPELKSRLFSLGAKAFLQKPYQPGEILRVIRGVIDVGAQTVNEASS
ncbi:MAG TPA: PAS domain S-box protein [Bacteroidota bacterium]|nr:PAS domain S-box protein [Bacteroidota bacterium]